MAKKNFSSSKFLNYLGKKLEEGNGLHMSLIDIERIDLDLKKIVEQCVESGTDILAIGGSTGIDPTFASNFIKSIKSFVLCPILLMPSPTCPVCDCVDAVFYFWMPQAREHYLSCVLPALAAPIIRRHKSEPIATGYLIFEPGMSVGRILDVDPLPRERADRLALGFAIASEIYGHRLLWLDSGSGSPEPINCSVIQSIKQKISIPIIVGGGIRDPETARNLVDAGADIIVTGNLLEIDNPLAVIEAVHSTARVKK